MERQAVAKVKNHDHRVKHHQPKPARSSPTAHPLNNLQRSIGNRAVQRLINSPYIQAKLQISSPEDPLEREADRTAETVMRMAVPDESDEKGTRVQSSPIAARIARLVQRESTSPPEEEDETPAASLVQPLRTQNEGEGEER